MFLTGATGLIGGEILPRAAKSMSKVWALVRADDDEHARRRLEERAFRGAYALPDAAVPVAGDICAPGLGIRPERLEQVRDECTDILHVAGHTFFDDEDLSDAVNAGGAREVLAFARSCRNLRRLFYMSSAAVNCGPAGTVIEEDQPFEGFANGYVRSKRRAEKVFKVDDLDVVILRPSIVTAHPLTDRRFNREIAWVIPLMERLGIVPLTGGERVDLVPVDYTADAVVRLLANRSLEKACYHISAGPDACVTTEAIRKVLETREGNQRTIRYVTDEEWAEEKARTRASRRALMTAIEYYLPFLRAGVVFSNRRLQEELDGNLPPCRPFTDYVNDIITRFSMRDALEQSMMP